MTRLNQRVVVAVVDVAVVDAMKFGMVASAWRAIGRLVRHLETKRLSMMTSNHGKLSSMKSKL